MAVGVKVPRREARTRSVDQSGYLSIKGMLSLYEGLSSIFTFAADLCCSEKLQQWPLNLMHASG